MSNAHRLIEPSTHDAPTPLNHTSRARSHTTLLRKENASTASGAQVPATAIHVSSSIGVTCFLCVTYFLLACRELARPRARPPAWFRVQVLSDCRRGRRSGVATGEATGEAIVRHLLFVRPTLNVGYIYNTS